MKKQTRIFLPLFFLLMLVSAACSIGEIAGTQVLDPAAQGTFVAQTVAAELTRSALQTVFAGITTQTPQASQTSGGPVLTSTPTATLPASTVTISIPTFTATASFTPTATFIPPTSTSTQIPCNQAKFESDISIPDNTQLPPGSNFTKTWRLKNIGSCTWSADYALVFVNGNSMSGPASVNLGSGIAPGQTVDVSVNLVAPATAGSYTGYWKLRTNNGVSFGLGANAASPFWVTIVVNQPAPTVDPSQPLNFVSSYCQATWSSSASASLPCNGVENFTNGSVMFSAAPKIEIAYQDNEPTLIMAPANGANGFVQGKYPAVTIQAGDHFSGLVGCMDSSPNCSVVFQLNYVEGANPVQNLGSWPETYDGNRTSLNVDLTPLAGKTVQFILTVTNSNGSSSDDRAFWEALRITR